MDQILVENSVIEEFVTREVYAIEQKLKESNRNNKKRKQNGHLSQFFFTDDELRLQDAGVDVTLEIEEIGNKNASLEGDKCLEHMRRCMKALSTATKQQKTFMEIFLQANLMNFYGDDFFPNEVRIKRENYIKELSPIAMVLCTRRMGKSYATAWFIASCLVSMPSIRMAVYSPAQRQSSFFTDMVKTFLGQLQKVPGVEPFWVVHGESNQELLGISAYGGKHHNVLLSLCSNIETTRGVTATLNVLEEAAAFDPKFIDAVIVPLLRVEKTALVAISSTRSDDNYYSQFVNFKSPDGKRPLFNTFQFYMACEECRMAQKASTCKHTYSDLPPWMSAAKEDIMRALYIQRGQTKMLEQETIGISHAIYTACFEPHLLATFFEPRLNPPLQPSEILNEVPYIFVSIDPSGGGRGSDFSMASAFYFNRRWVFCGIESIPAKNEYDCFHIILTHLQMLRTLPKCATAKLVLFIESNTTLTANTLTQYLYERLHNFVVPDKEGYDTSTYHLVNMKARKGSGVKTTHEVKEEMTKKFKILLYEKGLAFYNEMITIYGDTELSAEDKVMSMKRMAKDQLSMFSIVRTEPENPAMQDIKYTYSGKMGSDGSSKDDIACCFMLVTYWGEIYQHSPIFQQTGARRI